MTPSPDLVARIAPTGALRAAINLGNAVLAGRDPATGAAKGVSVDLAGELAKRLGVALELVVVDGAAKSVDAVVQRARRHRLLRDRSATRRRDRVHRRPTC